MNEMTRPCRSQVFSTVTVQTGCTIESLDDFVFFFFFPRTFFLAQGLVGAVLLGSFQACAIYIPAAPDVQGNRGQVQATAP